MNNLKMFETPKQKAERIKRALIETDRISEENKPRFKMDEEMVFDIEKENLSKEQKEDRI